MAAEVRRESPRPVIPPVAAEPSSPRATAAANAAAIAAVMEELRKGDLTEVFFQGIRESAEKYEKDPLRKAIHQHFNDVIGIRIVSCLIPSHDSFVGKAIRACEENSVFKSDAGNGSLAARVGITALKILCMVPFLSLCAVLDIALLPVKILTWDCGDIGIGTSCNFIASIATPILSFGYALYNELPPDGIGVYLAKRIWKQEKANMEGLSKEEFNNRLIDIVEHVVSGMLGHFSSDDTLAVVKELLEWGNRRRGGNRSRIIR